MSSEAPPSQIISPYNEAYWISQFNQTTANATYLRKNVQDKCTALQNFGSGIQTSTILPSGNYTITQNIFEDTTSTLTSFFGKTNSTNYFGYQSGNVKLGEQSIFSVEVGKSMPSRSGNRIAIGADASQDTNIAISTTTGGDSYSGTNKVCIGGPGNTTLLNSDTLSLGRTSSVITLNTALTPVYSYPVTSSQLGYQIPATGTVVTTGVTSFLVGAGLSVLPVGIYILNGSCSFPSNTFTFLKICFYASATQQTSGAVIASGSNNVPYGSLIINESSQVGSGINLYPLCSVINVVSGTQFYSIMGNMNGTAQTMTMSLTATRIA